MNTKKRELWLDNIRAIACLTVATVHLLQSLTHNNILTENLPFQWISYIVYAGSLQIFFFCSGYLHQKHSGGAEWPAHWKSIGNRFLSLMVPYLIFCSATYILKALFSQLVNSPVEGSLLKNIFWTPPNQMWFLMVLFLCYLVSPVFQTKKQGLLFLGAAAVMRFIYVALSLNGIGFLYFRLFEFLVFFAFGMLVAQNRWLLDGKLSYLGLLALPLTVLMPQYFSDYLHFGMLMAFLYLLLFILISSKLIRENRFFSLVSSQMLQIYLLHTMCAAPVRILLLKAGILSLPVHLIAGFAASIFIPIAIALIAKKLYWIDFVFSPKRAMTEFNNRRALKSK